MYWIDKDFTEKYAHLFFDAIESGALTAVDAVEKMVNGGMDVNVKDAQGIPALIRAIDYCRVPVVAYLLSQGADYTVRNKNNQSMVSIILDTLPVTRTQEKEQIQALIQNRINYDKGQEALENSYFFSEAETEKRQFDDDDRDYFIRCIGHSNISEVERYLKDGIDPNITNANKRLATPHSDYVAPALIFAAYYCNLTIVNMLLAAGADPLAKDSLGDTALDQTEYPGILKAIRDKINEIADKKAEKDSYFFSD